VPLHRLLCCTTMKGKIAFVRQLVPSIHFDVEPHAAQQLRPHIRRIFGLGPVLSLADYPEIFEYVHATPHSVVRL